VCEHIYLCVLASRGGVLFITFVYRIMHHRDKGWSGERTTRRGRVMEGQSPRKNPISTKEQWQPAAGTPAVPLVAAILWGGYNELSLGRVSGLVLKMLILCEEGIYMKCT